MIGPSRIICYIFIHTFSIDQIVRWCQIIGFSLLFFRLQKQIKELDKKFIVIYQIISNIFETSDIFIYYFLMISIKIFWLLSAFFVFAGGLSPEQTICLRCQTYADLYCVQCLQIYHRTHGINGKYQCLEGFVQKKDSTYCCHKSCVHCDKVGGCLTCEQRRFLNIYAEIGVTTCDCIPNFVEDRNGRHCICLPQNEQGIALYEDTSRLQCLTCPAKCICTPQKGCMSCSEDAARIIHRTDSGRYMCPCLSTYYQKDGECLLKKDCDPQNGTCLPSSHRKYDYFSETWECSNPYQSANDDYDCQILPPFEILDGVLDCIGNTPGVTYYRVGYQCFKCPEGCTCSKDKCVSCDTLTHRSESIFGECDCQSNFRQINGTCWCLSPNIYDPVSGACVEKESVFTCPQGCICSEEGCESCAMHTLRIDGDKACSCSTNAIQINGQCVCFGESTLVAVINDKNQSESVKQCVRPEGFYQVLGNYVKCPQQCRCDLEQGCYECDADSLWQSVQGNLPRCACKSLSQFNAYGECICVFMAFRAKSRCQCMEGTYQQNQQCLYPITNDSYFKQTTYKSAPCPFGCLCSDHGSYVCSTQSQRTAFISFIGSSMYSRTMFSSVCVEQTKQSLERDICITCQTNQYYLDGKCLNCTQSWTGNQTAQICNRAQALKCNPKERLNSITGLCECIDLFSISVDGQCVCSIGNYPSDSGSCEPCPYFCQTCYSPSPNYILCLSCNPQDNRDQRPDANCPCKTGYQQMLENPQYCCPLNCLTCDRSGCLTCSPFQNRILNPLTRKCQCLSGLVADSDTSACRCPEGKLLFNKECMACPSKCKNCKLKKVKNQARIVCVGCKEDSNRNPIDEQCKCSPGFLQADDGSVCYPEYCSTQTSQCFMCDPKTERVPSVDRKSCQCPVGTYETANWKCRKCPQPGCLDCSSQSSCLRCNQDKSYLLLNGQCLLIEGRSDFLVSQSTEGIKVLLFDFSSQITGVKAYLMENKAVGSTQKVNLKVLGFDFPQQRVLRVQIENPQKVHYNKLLALALVTKPKRITRQSAYLADPSYVEQTYITIDILSSASSFKCYLNLTAFGAYAVFFIGFILHLGLYLQSFKINFNIFYLQTLSFIGFNFPDPDLRIASNLFALRPIWLGELDVGEIVPNDYQEVAHRNFYVFTNDSNILRLCFYPLCLTALVIVLRLLTWTIFRSLSPNPISAPYPYRLSKNVSKTLEFLYKFLIYPIFYVSTVNLVNASAHYRGPSYFKALSLGVSSTCVLVSVLVTLGYTLKSHIQRRQRVEYLIEYISVVIASLVLACTSNTYWCLTVGLVVFLKDLLSIRNLQADVRKIWLRHYNTTLLAATLLHAASFALIAVGASMTWIWCCAAVGCYLFWIGGLILVLYHKRLKRRPTKTQKLQLHHSVSEVIQPMSSDSFMLKGDNSTYSLLKSGSLPESRPSIF